MCSVHFSTAQRNLTTADQIDVGGMIIERTRTIKYLGVQIDSHLTWTNHVDHVCRRVATAAGIIRKLSFLPIKILRQPYFSIAHSHLSYAAIVWASAKNKILNKLQILQRRALKACFRLCTRHSTFDLYSNKATNILPLKSIRVQQACELVFSSLHCDTPANVNFSYTASSNRHNRRQLLTMPRIHTKIGECSLSHFGPFCYNQLDREMHNIDDDRIFKRKLKIYLNKAENIQKFMK